MEEGTCSKDLLLLVGASASIAIALEPVVLTPALTLQRIFPFTIFWRSVSLVWGIFGAACAHGMGTSAAPALGSDTRIDRRMLGYVRPQLALPNSREHGTGHVPEE